MRRASSCPDAPARTAKIGSLPPPFTMKNVEYSDSGTGEHLRFRLGGIASKIIAATWLMFIVVIIIVASISYGMYRDAFYNYGNALCLTSNAQAAYAINGDLVQRFARTLKIDRDYEQFAAHLDALSSKINAKYFYILTDNGVPGMYTYIYDASHSEQIPGEKYALGRTETKDEYIGAAEVLATGQGFAKAAYYNDVYGELYYAYAPITNSKGEVVAFLGTDVDIAPLHEQVNHYRLVVFSTMFIALAVFSVIYFFIVRRILTLPLLSITSSALNLAQGDLNLQSSGKMLARRDEIGHLARAFETMSRSIAGVVFDIEHLMKSVRDGRVLERADLSAYRGDYLRIISGVNSTLDVVGRHFDALPEVVAFFDAGQNLLYGNVATHAFIQRHQLDKNGNRLLARIFSGQEEPGLEAAVNRLFQDESAPPLTADLRLSAPDSGETHRYSAMLLHTGYSDPAGGKDQICVMLVLTDTTQLINAKNDAEAASRAKSDFLSRMSHEIRTPMNAIIGMTQIMSGSTDLQKIDNCVQQIDRSAKHLLGIINDILDFSKIEAGKMLLEAREFSLSLNLGFVVSMVFPKAKEKRISIISKVTPLIHEYVLTDSLRLNQILINLLSNAIKFSNDGGRIELMLEELSHEDSFSVFQFTVRDHGIGMSEPQADRLFRPFEQANVSVSRAFGGTGLGLAISKSLVQALGGEIGFTSEPGRGSTFYFTIRVPARSVPINPPGAADKPDQIVPLRDFSGKRMLIVDDIDINRMIVLELMADSGMVMEEASNGREAVTMFEKSPIGHYDFILMDMQMPVMDGCEATEAIRALPRPDAAKVRIIAMTANVMQEDVDKALASGMNAHTGKPIDMAELFEKLAG